MIKADDEDTNKQSCGPKTLLLAEAILACDERSGDLASPFSQLKGFFLGLHELSLKFSRGFRGSWAWAEWCLRSAFRGPRTWLCTVYVGVVLFEIPKPKPIS